MTKQASVLCIQIGLSKFEIELKNYHCILHLNFEIENTMEIVSLLKNRE